MEWSTDSTARKGAGIGSATFVVLGDKQLQNLLRSLPAAVQKKVLAPSLRKAARLVQQAAKARSPVKTGLMRKSLTVNAIKGSRGRFGSKVTFRNGDQLASVSKAGKRYFYPAAVEYGHGRAFGKHFIRAAFNETEAAAEAVIAKEARKAIDELTKRVLGGTAVRK